MVTHDSLSDLRRHLNGQTRLAKELGGVLVVADNGSTDGSLELVRETAGDKPALRVVDMGRNTGYSTAVNAAFAAAPGRDVLLINPDVDPGDGTAARRLVDFLAARPGIGVAAPRLEGADGATQPSARRFPSPASLLGSHPWGSRARRFRSTYERHAEPSLSPVPRSVDWVIGACMLIRRAAYDAVGGWDERFFLYLEDADFCRRCHLAGWDVVFVPDVAMRHGYRRASRTGRSLLSSRERRSHMRSIVRLFTYHPRMIVGAASVTSPRTYDFRPDGEG